ncbi:Methyltransferase [Pseudonocardia sp. Ae168_Ps1]|uniref:class I SAM-dependent methyltransferase n=1 Tax=unclassified Pseudonocardia TaxID=2619320 RepID=UPI00094B109D|nr:MULTISPECIES: class I SAM-dependent methyltransferase [unclassified Pseudonocardia]OLL70212.1 Methyltransferase [Pseudonocardia sp. Ae150A_Ps1]OLL70608.1 Methyltransferase [Pseudonocardia sp. Ae168_Ps1]OLL70758.1 Methyltransferase [Pseudonocardia sp. Ae263_Ps1]OLL89319.1 Methyltransferase [Pseudonocardia sp. Ae356_Ps1]
MSPHSQYDSIGAAYDAVKELPAARYGEIPAVRALLGDLTGQKVLDLGCGTGHYARLCRDHGARHIDGVDNSTTMITEARRREQPSGLSGPSQASPASITYHVHDAAELPHLDTYDVVLAVYLFNYAPDRATLEAMLTSIRANCRPGTRLVALLTDPSSPLSRPGLRHYGIEFDITSDADPDADSDDAQDSTATTEIVFTAHCDPPVSFRLHAPHPHLIDECLRTAGFSEIGWGRCPVSPQGRDLFGDAYWAEYQHSPPWITVTALAGA